MKRIKFILTIALLILMSVNLKAQLVRSSIGYDYTPYVYAVCNELNINSDITIGFTTLNVQAYTFKKGNRYFIFVNNSIGPYWNIIAHELIHVWQDQNNMFDINKGTTIIGAFNDRIINKNIETQARELSKKIKWHYRKQILVYR